MSSCTKYHYLSPFNMEQRDRSFLGLHAPPPSSAASEHLDLYGTLRELEWRAPKEWLVRELDKARETLLRVMPKAPSGLATLPRAPSLNPEAWTVGHVAFTFDMLIADALGLEKPGALPCPGKKVKGAPTSLPRTRAWTVYDSMRVSGSVRWHLAISGGLPDATGYLDIVHKEARELVMSKAGGQDGGGLVVSRDLGASDVARGVSARNLKRNKPRSESHQSPPPFSSNANRTTKTSRRTPC